MIQSSLRNVKIWSGLLLSFSYDPLISIPLFAN